MITLYPLEERPKYIDQLAGWLHEEFKSYNPNQEIGDRINRLKKMIIGDELPIMYIALENDQLLGCASLVECDLKIRSELTPWLASVFVHPSFRKQGAATKLVSEIINHSKRRGFEKLYLFTPDQQRLYAKLGFEIYENLDYWGKNIDIMVKEL